MPGMPPQFDDAFRTSLDALLTWRRDVRAFRRDPLPPGALEALIATATRAPSVGNSQPWRFVVVENPARRARIRANFVACNRAALDGYDGERAQIYADLKLAGFDDAPAQLAVFADPQTKRGHGLGRLTMPESIDYSVVTAVTLLWLAARAAGIGVGWVSILEPDGVRAELDLPGHWRLVAYLCIGYPLTEADVPELERAGWQNRDEWHNFILRR